MIKNHIQNLIKNTKTIYMAIKLFAAMIISLQNQYKYTEDLMLYTNLWKKMLQEVKYYKNVIKYKFNKPLKMTKEDEENFKKADSCHICNKKYIDKDIVVKDHCRTLANTEDS